MRKMRNLMIVGLLGAAMAAPTGCGVGKYLCKSKQSEAKAKLAALVTAMAAAKDDQGSYPDNIGKLDGFDATSKYYDFKVVSAGADGFQAQAVGKDTMEGDVWAVGTGGTVTAITNACS